MRTTADLPDATNQARIIQELRRQKQLRFSLGVNASYLVLLAVLIFAFSGLEFTVLGAEFSAIALDWDFIWERTPFIFGGVGLTVLLSILSISLASVLALLGALGRLSKSPPAYALATFYISLIRGTPLLLQIFFFFLALPQLGITLTGFVGGSVGAGAKLWRLHDGDYAGWHSISGDWAAGGGIGDWYDAAANYAAHCAAASVFGW